MIASGAAVYQGDAADAGKGGAGRLKSRNDGERPPCGNPLNIERIWCGHRAGPTAKMGLVGPGRAFPGLVHFKQFARA